MSLRKSEGDILLRILLYKERDNVVAHCLKYDLMGHGRTKKQALLSLLGVIETQREYLGENDMLDDLYHPAPMEFWRKFKRAEQGSRLRL